MFLISKCVDFVICILHSFNVQSICKRQFSLPDKFANTFAPINFNCKFSYKFAKEFANVQTSTFRMT